jgi:hypothetical protein
MCWGGRRPRRGACRRRRRYSARIPNSSSGWPAWPACSPTRLPTRPSGSPGCAFGSLFRLLFMFSDHYQDIPDDKPRQYLSDAIVTLLNGIPAG